MKQKYISIVWIESGSARVGGNWHNISETDATQQLARAISMLPFKKTRWIVDDTLVPSLLLRELVDVPKSAEMRDAFFSWRYSQSLGLDDSQFVQALNLEKDTWLLSGIQQQKLDIWSQSAMIAGHSINQLVPRWVWLYNRLAPTREFSGILLSLGTLGNGTFNGTLIAWKDSIVLLRQWTDYVSIEEWNRDRVCPTIAYLQREGYSPQELHVWGSDYWPDCGISTKIIQPEIPVREIM